MAKARVVITATNEMQKGLNSSKRSLSEFEKFTQQLGNKIKGLLSFAAVAASIKLVTNEAKKCVQAFAEAEKVSKRLEAVWNNVGETTGKTSKEMDDLAESLEKVTYFSAESIKEAGLLLAATESLTADGFDRALQASMDLAAALGEDVTSAAQTLAKAIQEPETALSRLKTIGVSFTEDEKAQIKELTDANQKYEAQALILDKLEQKYKGVAQAINNTPVGLLDNISDTIDDIKKNLGEGIVNAISPILEDVYGWLVDISDWAFKWKNNGVSREEQAQIDSIGVFKNVALRGSIASVDELRQIESVWDILNQVMLDENTTAEEKQNFKKTLTYVNEIIEEWTSDVANSMQKALDDGFISSDRMAELIRQGIEYDGKNLTEELSQFFSKALHEWDTSLSPAAQARNRAVAIEGVNSFVSDNGSLSVSKTIADLESKLTDAWNIYAKAVSLGMDDMAGYILEIIGGIDTQIETLRKGNTEEEKSTKQILAGIEKIDLSLSDRIAMMFGATSEQGSGFLNSVFGSFTSNIGEAGEVIQTLAQNMATMGPLLGAIATALKYVLEGFGQVLGPVLNDFIAYGIEPLRELGRTIGEIVLPILQDIMPLVAESGRIIAGIFNELGIIIQPIVSFISSLLIPIIGRLTATLEVLEPILKVIGGALITVSTAFDWAGQWIRHIFAILFNALASIEIMGWRPLEGMAMADPGRPASYSEMWQANWDKMNQGYEQGSIVNAASTETAVSSASYRGATSVTINIYQEAPVVGDSGMRQFAAMIREEFEALDYYGVTA